MRAPFLATTGRVGVLRIRGLIAAGIVAGSVVLSMVPAPQANALANQRIYNQFYHRCLDVNLSSPTRNGTAVQLWDCHGGNNQAWTWYNDGAIKSSHDGRCLDLDLGYPGPGGVRLRVQVWDCHGGKNQKWLSGYVRGQILSAYNNRVLEANPSPTTPGRYGVQVWPAIRDHDNQLWSCDCHVPYPSRWR